MESCLTSEQEKISKDKQASDQPVLWDIFNDKLFLFVIVSALFVGEVLEMLVWLTIYLYLVDL